MTITSTLPFPESCDTPNQLIMAAMCLVAIVVCFAGYRLYMLALGLFGFLMAATVQAVNGFQWIALADDEEHERVIKQVIVVFFCLLWGAIGAVLCMKVSEKLQRLLGFILGSAGGVALVGALIYVLRQPVSERLGAGYEGWEGYAFFSLAPPVALLTGWLARDLIKRLLMLITAFLGAVVFVGCAESILHCFEVDLNAVSPVVQVGIIAVIGFLGFGIQVLTEPGNVSVAKSQQVEP